jgi:hypothetical protein
MLAKRTVVLKKPAARLDDLRGLVAGGEVVCLASGPSLTEQDVQLVRQWREAAARRAVFVANTTFRLAPWADALFAMDKKWWDQHVDEARRGFEGERFTSSPVPVNYGVRRLQPHQFNAHGNSGAACVSLAVACGAQRVLMLGYDCQHAEGHTHWHGDHPPGLGNAVTVSRWPTKFAALHRAVSRKAEVINCSRATALTMFTRMDLESCLAPR